MTKKEIVRRISDRAELTQLKTKEIVQWTFDAIIDTLLTDGRIELRNFGVFEVRRRKARRARNPRTNDRVDVPEKNVVTFQPGKEMEERVRREAKVYEPKRKKVKPVPAAKPKAAAPAPPPPPPPPTPTKTKAAPKAKAKAPPAPDVGVPSASHNSSEHELIGHGAPTTTPAHDEAPAHV